MCENKPWEGLKPTFATSVSWMSGGCRDPTLSAFSSVSKPWQNALARGVSGSHSLGGARPGVRVVGHAQHTPLTFTTHRWTFQLRISVQFGEFGPVRRLSPHLSLFHNDVPFS